MRLVSTTDQYTSLKPGDTGTVVLVDSMGTVHVKWDGGSSLGLVPGEDRYEVIEPRGGVRPDGPETERGGLIGQQPY